MTTGSISEGYPYSAYYYTRSWGGDDGKVDSNGKLKFNNYHLESSFERNSPSTLGFYPFGPGVPSFSSLWSANDDVALQSKLVGKIKEHDFNLSVNIAQGKQTVNMVVENLGKLGRAAVALKHGDVPTTLRCLGSSAKPRKLQTKDISGRWLELQYGWLPMLGDTYEAMMAYHKLTQKARSSTVKATRTKRLENQDSSQSPGNFSCLGTTFLMKQIVYRITESLSAPRSLGLTDPLSVAWEIAPWSFVIDWFVPIGSFFDNLNVIPYLDGASCTTEMISRSYITKETPGTFYYQGVSGRGSSVRLNRTAAVGLKLALPGFTSIPEAMSSKRIWNAIALAHQKFR